MSWKVSNRFPRNANIQSHENPYDEALIIQQELDDVVHEQLLIVDRDIPSLNSEQHNTIFNVGSHLGGSPKNWGAPPNFVDLLT